MSYIQTSIDHRLAAERLEAAFIKASTISAPVSKYSSMISQVILGTHVTYRYILVTNLLAKTSNKSAHGLALQAGANLDGAFDSRSLCHQVLVPFERKKLQGRLGRSNEPYLNKPARQKQLAPDNPVRRGNDRRILELCIYILSHVQHMDALEALADALYYVLQRESNYVEFLVNSTSDLLYSRLIRFSKELLENSHEGETSAFIAGLGFYLLSSSIGGNFSIKVHPTNQAGTSSNEISDIDVLDGKKLVYTAEVKDKGFTLDDIDHAAAKVRAACHNALFFIVGPHGYTQVDLNKAIEMMEENHGVKVAIVHVHEFFQSAMGIANDKFDEDFIREAMNKIIEGARFKDLTIESIRRNLKASGLS